MWAILSDQRKIKNLVPNMPQRFENEISDNQFLRYTWVIRIIIFLHFESTWKYTIFLSNKYLPVDLIKIIIAHHFLYFKIAIYSSFNRNNMPICL